MSFTIGHCYSRPEISEVLGGEIRMYLPSRNGQVVCGCFDPERNPGAPREVLVGVKPRNQKRAEMMLRQGGAIPVFLKRGSGRWEYVGRHVITGDSTDRRMLQQKEEEAGRPVTRVLYFEESSQR